MRCGPNRVTSAISRESRVGRYKLVKRLAVGGMADIWLAQEFGPRGYERTVVVKTIRADLVDEEELIQMLVEEARIAACLKHDNIVELYEVGEESGTHYLAMEFVFGRDLRQVRDYCLEHDLRIPFEHITTIAACVLDALQYAYHDATYEEMPLRVIHRDISPQNIIVGFDGSVKLLDFGIAKAAAQLSRTRAGVLKGKYGYMAPEQVDFKDLDQRADVFATSIVLWESMTQKRLFYRDSEYETVQAVLACEVPFPRVVRPDVPWALGWIAYRGLRRNPKWRYQDAAAMRKALLRWDGRSREQAHDELAEWMSEIYNDDLRQRETTLMRVREEPTRHRQIMDAGFELIEEPTRSDRGVPVPSPAEGQLPRRKRSSVQDVGTTAPPGIVGLITSTLGTWKWFLLLMSALVFLGLATGIYIASWQAAGSDYGWVSVTAPVPDVQVIIGDRPVGTAPVRDIKVLPGRHRIEGVRGGQRVVVEIQVPRGARETIELKMAPPGT